MVYENIYNVLVFNKNFLADHLKALDNFLQKIVKAGLKLNT